MILCEDRFIGVLELKLLEGLCNPFAFREGEKRESGYAPEISYDDIFLNDLVEIFTHYLAELVFRNFCYSTIWICYNVVHEM